MLIATRLTFTMLRPMKHTRRPKRMALSMIICIRWMLLANMATITRPSAVSNIFSNVSPTFSSLIV